MSISLNTQIAGNAYQTNLNLKPKISKENEVLKNQIVAIGMTNPDKASMLSRKIVMWDGSQKALDDLSSEGLNVSHFGVCRLLGGMHNEADLDEVNIGKEIETAAIQDFSLSKNLEENKIAEITFSKDKNTISVKVSENDELIYEIMDQKNIKMPEQFREFVTKEFFENATLMLEKNDETGEYIAVFSSSALVGSENLGSEVEVLFRSNADSEVKKLIEKYGDKVLTEPFEFTQMQLSTQTLSNFFKISEEILKDLDVEGTLVVPGKAFQKSLINYRQDFSPNLAANFDVSLSFVDKFKNDTTEMFNLCVEENDKEELIDVVSSLAKEFSEIQQAYVIGKADLTICSEGLDMFSKGITAFSVATSGYIQKLFDKSNKELENLERQKQNLETALETLDSKEKSIKLSIEKHHELKESFSSKKEDSLKNKMSINEIIEQAENNLSLENLTTELKKSKQTEIDLNTKYMMEAKQNLDRSENQLYNHENEITVINNQLTNIHEYRNHLMEKEKDKHLASRYTWTTGSSSWFHNSRKTHTAHSYSINESYVDQLVQSRKVELKDKLSNFQNSTIPICHRQIEKDKNYFNQYKDLVEKITQEKNNIVNELTNVDKIKHSLKKEEKNIEEKIKSIENEIKSLLSEIEKHTNEVEDLKKGKIEIENSITVQKENIKDTNFNIYNLYILSKRVERAQPNPEFIKALQKFTEDFDVMFFNLFAKINAHLVILNKDVEAIDSNIKKDGKLAMKKACITFRGNLTKAMSNFEKFIEDQKASMKQVLILPPMKPVLQIEF